MVSTSFLLIAATALLIAANQVRIERRVRRVGQWK